jgi:hypothetical protein
MLAEHCFLPLEADASAISHATPPASTHAASMSFAAHSTTAFFEMAGVTVINSSINRLEFQRQPLVSAA